MSGKISASANIGPCDRRELDGQGNLSGIVVEYREGDYGHQTVAEVLRPVLEKLDAAVTIAPQLVPQEVPEADELCREAFKKPRAGLPEILFLGVHLEALGRSFLGPSLL